MNEQSLSLSELSRFLTQLHTQSQTVDVKLTDTRGTEQRAVSAIYSQFEFMEALIMRASDNGA